MARWLPEDGFWICAPPRHWPTPGCPPCGPMMLSSRPIHQVRAVQAGRCLPFGFWRQSSKGLGIQVRTVTRRPGQDERDGRSFHAVDVRIGDHRGRHEVGAVFLVEARWPLFSASRQRWGFQSTGNSGTWRISSALGGNHRSSIHSREREAPVFSGVRFAKGCRLCGRP